MLGFVIEAKGTNNFISLYMNRTGFQCIGSLFMMKNMNTLVTCSDCGDMDKIQRKEGIKNSVDWTLDNCVCFRESIIISAKNNKNTIFIINNPPPEVYAKSGESFFLLKYSSTSMTF